VIFGQPRFNGFERLVAAIVRAVIRLDFVLTGGVVIMKKLVRAHNRPYGPAAASDDDWRRAITAAQPIGEMAMYNWSGLYAGRNGGWG